MRKFVKAIMVAAMLATALWVVAARAGTVLTFTNTPLTLSFGSSEPEIAFDGAFMAVTSLSWLLPDGTQLWTGKFGSTPSLQGAIDSALTKAGFAIVFGGADASITLDSSGNLLASTLVVPVNKPFRSALISVSAIRCPNAMSTDFSTADCTAQVIDNAGNDRPWITSDGSQVYISYHDARNSELIRVQRSDDDGVTWTRVGDAITGAGGATASSTFNNFAGPIAADPISGSVYQAFVAGQTGILKAKTTDFDDMYVSHSTDSGMHWTPVLVFAGPLLSTSGNLFPAVAVDPTNGDVYAVWSNASASGTDVYFSYSADGGDTWSPAVVVNSDPANTAIFPWVAAYNGTADVTYYGTPSANDASAVWNVYLAQTTDNGSSFTESLVSNASNHTGVICTKGTACAPGTRNLLDLFQVGIDPANGKAAVVYVDDAHTKDASGNPLPQTVLAQQQ